MVRDVGSQSAAKPREFAYTAKIIDGQIFLSLNSAPDQMIGPFSKKSDTEYVCETKGEGVHSLTTYPESGWYYSWSYIHMRAQAVDAGVLEK